MNVVIDLEHTISNSHHRLWMLAYDDNELRRKFQKEFINDTVNINVKLFIESLIAKGYNVTILTAKLDCYYDDVCNWLKKHDVKYTYLLMKPSANDGYSDLEFKERYVSKNKHSIAFALDDVGENCAMFAKHNIPCLRIVQR